MFVGVAVEYPTHINTWCEIVATSTVTPWMAEMKTSAYRLTSVIHVRWWLYLHCMWVNDQVWIHLCCVCRNLKLLQIQTTFALIPVSNLRVPGSHLFFREMKQSQPLNEDSSSWKHFLYQKNEVIQIQFVLYHHKNNTINPYQLNMKRDLWFCFIFGN